MNLRTATPEDNNALAELSKLTPMEGTISVCIQRSPDFFSLLHRMGTPHVIIAEENDTIIGCISIVKEEIVLQDQSLPLYYLCDLKVHPDHRNRKVGTKLSMALHEYLKEQKADLLFTTVADNNIKVMPIIDGKAGIEGTISAGKFYILQLVPKKKITPTNGYVIIKYEDEEEIINKQLQFAEKYVLHPPVTAEYFKDCFHFAATEGNQIVATASLTDPGQLKQNVLNKIPWYYKAAIGFLRFAKPVLHTPYLPRTGEAIRMLYVKDFSYLSGHENALVSLIEYANQYAWQNDYSFLSITFHENDPLRSKFKKFMAFPFVAHGKICSLQNNQEILSKIKAGNVFKDFSLV
jgi:ribosomal protein S18 acetylase RimI-like enzyme